MPRDGLPLPVGVCSQDQCAALLQSLRDAAHVRGRARALRPGQPEVCGRVHSVALWEQIAYVTVGGQHL
jgi:hypothetical protein